MHHIRTIGLTHSIAIAIDSLDILNHSYSSFVTAFGLIPIPIPTISAEFVDLLDPLGLDAILLTGGNDLFRQEMAATEDGLCSEMRDRAETRIVDYAVKRFLPIFGICRGLQFLNVYFGGYLEYDIHPRALVCKSHVRRYHDVTLLHPNVARIARETKFLVNSYHNHAVTRDSLAPALAPVAVCTEDTIVEALLHPDLPIFAVQWHPERDNPITLESRLLFQGFLDRAYWPSLFSQ